ncbi:formyltransferase family protein [Galbibacter sp. EGI 63066]|uniref:methionyl-tRNA formyltransferase n=1 Tax=Galbibacter sp. EGI 63066 TaxID=2993559 RepID=UPI0022491DB6|nr:formyltransferase family protein [Galbibacter sp. EGI 63066]MCX2680683.1 formyltransferase family protein [Galbibacter sp. EGI 63066]
MRKLRIGYFADGPWSHLAFEKIISNNNIEINFITPRFDTKDEKLKEYANTYGIDYVMAKDINSKSFLEKVEKYNCDLFVSMSFNQIFKSEIINIPKYKIINCHAGKLPFYRGRNILNWALINDEKEFGITVHFVDEGIDTGDIIIQRIFPITDNDDYKTLLNIAYSECASILYDSILLFLEGNGKVPRIKQESIHSTGMYCGIRTIGDEIISWDQPSRRVFNFIRAICVPGPQGITYLDNNEVKINKIKLIPNAPSYIGKPGQILCKTKNDTFYIKTGDSYIEVIEYTGKLKVGKVLKSNKNE